MFCFGSSLWGRVASGRRGVWHTLILGVIVPTDTFFGVSVLFPFHGGTYGFSSQARSFGVPSVVQQDRLEVSSQEFRHESDAWWHPAVKYRCTTCGRFGTRCGHGWSRPA